MADDELSPPASASDPPKKVRVRLSLEEGRILTPSSAAGDAADFTEHSAFSQQTSEADEILATLSTLPPVEPIRLSFCQKITVASGHFLNDLCASLWFSYLLLYLEFVVGFNDEDSRSTGSDDSKYAAGLMLLGQLVDGIATPIIGYEVDHSHVCSRNYGRCKAWHLAGSVMVLFSFPFVFSPVIGGTPHTVAWAKMLYYCPFIVIFQIGWASVQVSHLGLIPKMHPDELVRTELFSMRYAFTVAANVTVFIMTWLKLQMQQDQKTKSGGDCKVDKEDAYTFMTIALIAVGFGSLTTLLFHLGVKEKPDSKVKEQFAVITSRTELIRRLSQVQEVAEPAHAHDGPVSSSRRRVSTISRRSYEPRESPAREADEISKRALIDENSVEERLVRLRLEGALSEIENATEVVGSLKQSTLSTTTLNTGKAVMNVKDWLSLPQTYIVAFIYMTTRLSLNLGQVYVPLYSQESLRKECTSVALIPLTMYLSGFCVSMVIKWLNKHCGRQISYSLGAALSVIGSLLVLLLDWDGPNSVILKEYVIYAVAVLLGAGASAILVTSLSITADLIGSNVDSGAFVYGSMSFTDKLSCGLVILLTNSLVPCPGPPGSPCKSENIPFYRNVLGYSIGGCAVAGVLGVILLTFYIHRQNLKKEREAAIQRRSVVN